MSRSVGGWRRNISATNSWQTVEIRKRDDVTGGVSWHDSAIDIALGEMKLNAYRIALIAHFMRGESALAQLKWHGINGSSWQQKQAWRVAHRRRRSVANIKPQPLAHGITQASLRLARRPGAHQLASRICVSSWLVSNSSSKAPRSGARHHGISSIKQRKRISMPYIINGVALARGLVAWRWQLSYKHAASKYASSSNKYQRGIIGSA